MANKEPEVGVRLNVNGFISNAKQAKSALEKLANTDLSGLGKKISGLGSSLASGMKTLALGAAAGAAAGIAGAGLLINNGLNNVLDDTRVYDRMKQVFDPSQFDFLNDISNKMKSAFQIDDGDARKAMVLLGEMSLSAEQAGASMGLAADISRAKNIGIEESAKLVGLAYQGNMKAAKALGLEVDKSLTPAQQQAALLDQMQKKFGGSAEAYAKNLPPFERMKQALIDMNDTVAEKLMPIVMPLVERLSAFFVEAANSGALQAFAEGLANAFKTAWTFAKTIGTTLITYGVAFFDIIQKLPAVLGRMWDSGKLVDLFISYVGFGVKVVWNGIQMLGSLLWTAITQGLPVLIGFIGKGLIDMLRSVFGETISKKMGLDTASEAMNNMMKNAGSNMADQATEAFKTFGQRTKEDFSGMASVASDAFQAGGLDISASVDAAKQKTAGMLSFGGNVKQQMAQDTADLYGMTGRASKTLGMSKIAKKTADAKTKKLLHKGVDKMNKKAGVKNLGGMSLNINLQSADRLNPIMATT